MKTVKQLVNGRAKRLHHISSETTVQAAIHIMSSESVNALPVMENNQLAGIISEHDCIRKVVSRNIPAWSVKIHEVMTKDVITVDMDSPLEECMRRMTTNRICHLPVMEDNKLTTVLSITDVIAALYPP